jgi:hypothetical protein
MTWQPGPSASRSALVPRKIPGGPVVKVAAQVWRGRIWRKLDGARAPAWDVCPHNHTKRSGADACAGRAARRLNRLARKDHEPWPAEGKLRSLSLQMTVGGDERKVSPRAFPLAGVCQPCGRLIVMPAVGEPWEHQPVREESQP